MKVQVNEKSDIITLIFDNLRESFKFSEFMRKFNHCEEHYTSLFKNNQYIMYIESKQKHNLYVFKSKNGKFSFFRHELENEIKKDRDAK